MEACSLLSRTLLHREQLCQEPSEWHVRSAFEAKRLRRRIQAVGGHCLGIFLNFMCSQNATPLKWTQI